MLFPWRPIRKQPVKLKDLPCVFCMWVGIVKQPVSHWTPSRWVVDRVAPNLCVTATQQPCDQHCVFLANRLLLPIFNKKLKRQCPNETFRIQWRRCWLCSSSPASSSNSSRHNVSFRNLEEMFAPDINSHFYLEWFTWKCHSIRRYPHLPYFCDNRPPFGFIKPKP